MGLVTATKWRKIQGIGIARALSVLGTELSMFTLVFREKSLGPGAVALLFIFGALPMILFSPWAGTIADRFTTRQVVPIFSIIAGLSTLAQIFQLPIWASLILLFISGTCSSVVPPTLGKLVRSLAIDDDFSRVNGLIQTYFAISMLFGPFIAGLLVSTTGFVATFVIDGIFTTLIAAVPFLLKLNFKPELLEAGEKMRISEGFRLLRNDPFLRSLTIMVFFMVLCMSVVNVGEVFLLTEQLHANALIYGLVAAAFAFGTLVGSFLASKFKVTQKTELILLGIGLGFLSISAVGVGAAPNYWFVMVIWLLAGFGNSSINSFGVGMMFRSIPMEVQGRTFAAFNGIITAAGIGSQALAGAILGILDVRTLFISAGVIAFISFIIHFPSVYKEQLRLILATNREAGT